MSSIRAFIENIIYYNEENYYAVLQASEDGAEITLVGYFPYISVGESIEATGEHTSHPVYGEQFSVSSFQVIPPEGADAIERYLAGGAIKGIGPALAKRIVKKFKADTFRIIEEEPERLSEVKGISETMAMSVSEQAQMKRGMRDAVMYMQQYGIGANLANRIYERYGPALYMILNTNPYQLAEDLDGIGFRTADNIAIKMGISEDSEFRIRCGLLYVLTMAAADGHTWLPKYLLRQKSSELLGLGLGEIDRYLMDLQIDGRIVILSPKQEMTSDDTSEMPAFDEMSGAEPWDISGADPWELPGEQGENILPQPETAEQDQEQIYLAAYYYTERNIAERLHSLAIHGECDPAQVDRRIRQIEKETGIELDEQQREAIRASVTNGLLIVTGGPGTGKTTTINTLIRYYAEDHDEIMLAAPTGRAAKRMTEATGQEAKTIHRMLEYTGVPEQGNAPGSVSSYEGTRQGLDGEAAPYAGAGNAGGAGSTSGKGRFMRDEKDPLEADVLIIDEMSMVDIFLMDALLKAVVPGTRVILVGDSNQLPSVGAGNVLRDMIDSGCFETVRLTRIFRQAAQSDIILNAHRINRGEPVDLAKRSEDFLFIRSRQPESIAAAVRSLITEKLPAYVGCDRLEIQVLCATRKGALGVELLNRELQAFLNPPDRYKTELKNGEQILREGDKVMQIKNDYDLEWIRHDAKGLPMEHGTGVFNGDIGRILKIDTISDTVTVVFDEDRQVEYDKKQIRNLELAYAVTVHKSQGSEYPAVIMPMYRGPHLLMNRNLLYTAVTRARKCVCMVGLPQVFEEMERNESENKRYSGLRDRIRERYTFSGTLPGLP
ncbi:MAG: Flp pilus assembly complex ATPase component TadA [Lachnospiraceae bacterium]|nr:Flp pilus assembly complex ATPase component TadA [Lachnospiraceae bacterium]